MKSSCLYYDFNFDTPSPATFNHTIPHLTLDGEQHGTEKPKNRVLFARWRPTVWVGAEGMPGPRISTMSVPCSNEMRKKLPRSPS
jgi:hypothetical protein